MENEPSKIRYNRRLRNFFFKPRAQLQIVLSITSLGALGNVAIISMFVIYFRQTVPVDGIPLEARTDLLTPGFNWIFICTVTILVITAILSIFIGIVQTHRLFGPTLPLLRQIDSLRKGNYAKRGHLRKNDELKEVLQALNDLAADLESKSTKLK